MKISYEDHNTISVVTLTGEFTADQGDAFRRMCLERLESGIRDVVLNLENLSLVDSAGLELFLWLVEEAAKREGQVRLVKLDDLVRKVFQLTRLDRRFDIHPSIESAAKSLR